MRTNALPTLPADLAAATPLEVDTLLETLYLEHQRRTQSLGYLADSMRSQNGERRQQLSRTRYTYAKPLAETIAALEGRPDERRRGQMGTVADLLAEYRQGVELVREVEALEKILNAEYQRRPWSRFFTVQAHNGHIHSSMNCQTCNRNGAVTSFGWNVALSGKTEAEAVELLGPSLCTVCFPSAPVAWTLGKPDTSCTGTIVEGSKRQVGGSLRGPNYYGDCTCGKTGVQIKADGTPRKHQPETPPAPTAASAAAEVEQAGETLDAIRAAAADAGVDLVPAGVPMTAQPEQQHQGADVEPAGDDQAAAAPAPLVPVFAPFDEIEHQGEAGTVYVVDSVTPAGRVVARVAGQLAMSARFLVAKCRLVRSADDVAAAMTRDERVAELTSVARYADRTRKPADLNRLRALVTSRYGLTVDNGHVKAPDGYLITQGIPSLASMLAGDRALVLRVVRESMPAGPVHFRLDPLAAVRCGEPFSDAIRLTTVEDDVTCAGCAPDAPVVDADRLPVESLDGAMVTDQVRMIFIGRVRAPECGHYMAASERRAGLTRCERCPDYFDGDQDDEPRYAPVRGTWAQHGSPAAGTWFGTDVEPWAVGIPVVFAAEGENARVTFGAGDSLELTPDATFWFTPWPPAGPGDQGYGEPAGDQGERLTARYSRRAVTLSVGPADAPGDERTFLELPGGGLPTFGHDGRQLAGVLAAAGYRLVGEWGPFDMGGHATADVERVDGLGPVERARLARVYPGDDVTFALFGNAYPARDGDDMTAMRVYLAGVMRASDDVAGMSDAGVRDLVTRRDHLHYADVIRVEHAESGRPGTLTSHTDRERQGDRAVYVEVTWTDAAGNTDGRSRVPASELRLVVWFPNPGSWGWRSARCSMTACGQYAAAIGAGVDGPGWHKAVPLCRRHADPAEVGMYAELHAKSWNGEVPLEPGEAWVAGRLVRMFHASDEQLGAVVAELGERVPSWVKVPAAIADLSDEQIVAGAGRLVESFRNGTSPTDRDTTLAILRRLAELAEREEGDGPRQAATIRRFVELVEQLDDQDDAAAIAGAAERQGDAVLTAALQAAGEPVGEMATDVEVPGQRAGGGSRTVTDETRGGFPGLVERVIQTHRESLEQLLRGDGFAPGTLENSDLPILRHPGGVTVWVDEGGTMITYPDANIDNGEYGDGVGWVRLAFGAGYGAIRDVAVGLVAIAGGTAPQVTASSAEVENLLRLVAEYGQAAAIGGDTRRAIDAMARAKQEAGARYDKVRVALLELVGRPPGTLVDVEALTAAVELHRPVLSDKYGRPTTDADKVVHRRCGACGISVPVEGCRTWATGSYGVQPAPAAADDVQHVTTIDEKDGAGHWGWHCLAPASAHPAGDGDGTGYETADEVLEAATAHGPLAADSLRPADDVEAVFLPGDGAAGNSLGTGARIEIDGETFPIPDRVPHGGVLASSRIVVALRWAGYESTATGGFPDWTADGVMVRRAAWGSHVRDTMDRIVAFLVEINRAITWQEIDEHIGAAGKALPMPMRELLAEMYAADLIMANGLPDSDSVRFSAVGRPCADCEENGQNCTAHKTYDQRRRDGW